MDDKAENCYEIITFNVIRVESACARLFYCFYLEISANNIENSVSRSFNPITFILNAAAQVSEKNSALILNILVILPDRATSEAKISTHGLIIILGYRVEQKTSYELTKPLLRVVVSR